MIEYQKINYPWVIRNMRLNNCSMAEIGFFIVLTFMPDGVNSRRFYWDNRRIKAEYAINDSAYVWRLRKSLLEKGYLTDLGNREYQFNTRPKGVQNA